MFSFVACVNRIQFLIDVVCFFVVVCKRKLEAEFVWRLFGSNWGCILIKCLIKTFQSKQLSHQYNCCSWIIMICPLREQSHFVNIFILKRLQFLPTNAKKGKTFCLSHQCHFLQVDSNCISSAS